MGFDVLRWEHVESKRVCVRCGIGKNAVLLAKVYLRATNAGRYPLCETRAEVRSDTTRTGFGEARINGGQQVKRDGHTRKGIHNRSTR